ncbi:MAG: phosphoribosylaminoimidazolesuccinocarboxamide synthase [Christensenellaceae bacterium]|jgi:phosphoribosylaminoimidazole-succinocarboxamide synthase
MERSENTFLYEGKAKTVYRTEDPDLCIIEYRNTATAFNGEKREELEGKAVLNTAITNVIYPMLMENGIKTHYVDAIDDTSILVKKVEIVPLEVIVRNIAAGSFSARYGVPEGTVLSHTVTEFSYKNDDLGDPLINDSHVLALRLASKAEIDEIVAVALKINTLLQDFFAKANLTLVDFKLEFGRFHGEILLADEISPDTCRLWDKETGEKMDKDRFRRDLGNVMDAYAEVFRRINT